MAKKLKASEFEGSGPKKTGVFGLASAIEKLRVIRRTEQDPSGAVDLEMTPDRWREGGLHDPEDVKSGTIGLPGT